jgi:hypothetical protein
VQHPIIRGVRCPYSGKGIDRISAHPRGFESLIMKSANRSHAQDEETCHQCVDELITAAGARIGEEVAKAPEGEARETNTYRAG